jgi:hypothetical protein
MRGAGRERGMILLEVLVAVVLIGLVVGPLAAALSGVIGQSRAVREAGAGEAASRRAGTKGLEGWGPRLTEASWRPGPMLRVATDLAGGVAGPEATVGIWVDGWAVGEVPVCAEGEPGAASGEVIVPASVWSGRAGGEVVLRVRTGAGSWGPPWRSAVPGQDGGAPAVGTVAGAESERPTSVVHRPGIGTSKLTASWAAAPLTAPTFPLLFTLSASVQGWGQAVLDGRSQWWRMEEGRSVDLFY